MRTNTRECEAQQEKPPFGECVAIGRMIFHYNSRSRSPFPGANIMWHLDGSVTVGRKADSAEFYAPVFYITFAEA